MSAPNAVPVQAEVSASATGDAAANIAKAKAKAEAAAKARAETLAGYSFAEIAARVLAMATWADVLASADAIAKVIAANAIAEKTLSAQLRKIATLAPKECAAFRVAVVSYQLSGRRANQTQGAELASKLPTLRKIGSLRAGEITFGGLALPPSIGEF